MLGGTFNPVHFGHLSVASQIAWQFSAPVHLVLSARPPHRQGVVSAEQRWEMLQLALKGQPELIADRRELDRDGPSFMVDTLAALKQEFPATAVCLALGSDAAAGLDSWHRCEELAGLCHLIVIERPGQQPRRRPEMLDELGFSPAQKPQHLRTDQSGCWLPMTSVALEISASAIRQLAAAGGPINFMTPASVVEYVSAAGLYAR